MGNTILNEERCPKCGHYVVFYLQYVAPGATHSTSQGAFAGECIVKECRVCGYKYSVPTADKGEQ